MVSSLPVMVKSASLYTPAPPYKPEPFPFPPVIVTVPKVVSLLPSLELVNLIASMLSGP